MLNYIPELISAQFTSAKKKQSVPLLCHAMIKFFLLLCSLEAEEVATHGAPEAWKEARERVDKTFQVFFHTFVSPAQYILYLIQLNCTKVNDDVNDEYEDIDDYDDIYIMMKCLFVCLSRKIITSSWESPVTT